MQLLTWVIFLLICALLLMITWAAFRSGRVILATSTGLLCLFIAYVTVQVLFGLRVHG